MRRSNLEAKQTVQLREVLPKTLESIKRIGRRVEEDDAKKIFFAKLKNARMLRINRAKKIVVLVNSAEEASAATSEGFLLALKEYVWTTKNKRAFRGFQFFVSSPQDAEIIKRIVPSQGKIPKKDNCRVNFCTMHKNVNLRWLARKFIEQKSLVT